MADIGIEIPATAANTMGFSTFTFFKTVYTIKAIAIDRRAIAEE